MLKITIQGDVGQTSPNDIFTPSYLLIYLVPNGEVKLQGDGIAKLLGVLVAPLADKVDLNALINSLGSKILEKVDLKDAIAKFIAAKFGGGK